MWRGITMTAHAPLHGEWSYLVDASHLIDAPMTGLTPDTLGDVRRMIEIHEIGKCMDAIPLHRPAGGEALTHGRELR